MNHILHDHLGEFVIVYLDDVVIYFKSMTEHVKHLDCVLGQLKWVGLKINVEKCEFAKSEIKLLGHRISAEGTISNPGKVTAIEALERSTTISKLREFLEAVGFFRKDLDRSLNYSIIWPLLNLETVRHLKWMKYGKSLRND